MRSTENKQPSPTDRTFRQVTRELIRGLCVVLSDVRKRWIDERFLPGADTQCLPPEDLVIRQVLRNLDVAEAVARLRKAEQVPKLYLSAHERTSRPSPTGPREPAGPPRAA